MPYQIQYNLSLMHNLVGLSILLLLSSCQLEPEIGAPLSSVPPEIEINGIIIDGHRAAVTVNRVSSAVVGDLDNSLPNAEVILFEDGKPIDTFKLDTMVGFVASRIASKFVSTDTIGLRSGRTYHIECFVPDLPTAISAKQTFQRKLRVDSVIDPESILSNDRQQFINLVDFDLIGLFPKVSDPIWATVAIGRERRPLAAFDSLPDFLTPLNFRFPVELNDSTNTQANFRYDITNFGPSFGRDDQENFLLFRIVRLPANYQNLIDDIIVREGQLGSFNTTDTDFEPLPSNAQEGLGSFYIAESYFLVYELPPQ